MFNSSDIFNINSEKEFENLALEIFNYQSKYNVVYREWISFLGLDVKKVTSLGEIPFLPIRFFKSHNVSCFNVDSTTGFFSSSGTTAEIKSKHFIKDIKLYEKSFLEAFELHFGDPKDLCFLFLLPGYSENKNSSLIYMCNELLKQSNHQMSGFYLDDLSNLIEIINELKQRGEKTILFGVSYALIDLAEKEIALSDNIQVVETGGMKGKRREMVKEELHRYLKSKFELDCIGGEYGMTELFSQAYSDCDGIYSCPPWMKIKIVDVNDPFSSVSLNKTGGINVIDLANIHTCSFIATQDLGRNLGNGTFTVQGRFDNSDLRGCNLLIG